MQGNINIALGCDYLKDKGHIDKDAGIFVALTEEVLIPVRRGIVLPARNNTTCKCRGTPRCNVECPRAVTVYQSGHHWSPRQSWKRM